MKLHQSSKSRYQQFRERLRILKAKGEKAEESSTNASGGGGGGGRWGGSGGSSGGRWGGDRKRPNLDAATRKAYRRQYLAMLRPQFWGLVVVVTLTLLSASFGFVQPWLTQKMLDGAILTTTTTTSERIGLMNRIGFAMIAVAVLSVLIGNARGYWTTVVSARVVYRLRSRLLDHLLQLPIQELADMKTGGVTSRLNGDVSNAATLVQSAIIMPGTAAIQALTALIILLTWNWKLALAVAGAAAPLVIMHWMYVRRIRPVWRSVHEDQSALDGRATETFGGIRVVRAFRREKRSAADDGLGQHTVARKQHFAHKMERLVESGWGLVMPGVTLVILWYGGYLVVSDQVKGVAKPTTVGQLFAFQMYILMLLGPVMRLVSSISQTQRSLAAMERVFDVLAKPKDKPDAPDAVDLPGVVAVSAERGERASLASVVKKIALENVSFEYRAGVPVLNDVSFEVEGGSVVALVGPSGAGKTTMTDLIARFHDPTSGRITLNGVDLRKIKLAQYRSLLAIVQQETFLFDGTVRENIAFGRRGASVEEVREAARRAHADEFIDTLPEGYDTIIGERGLKLSGGQRQRLAIARAILADPAILILDEATSNLDSHSEQLIQDALAELFRHRTTFVIAHRLSTITHADLIVCFEKGRVVQTGTHEELMAIGGLYREMVDKQRSAFESRLTSAG